MTALYHLNENIAHLLEGFLESAVPLIAGLAEAIGLFIIVTSLVKATYHYVRATFFRDRPRPFFCRTSSRSCRWPRPSRYGR